MSDKKNIRIAAVLITAIMMLSIFAMTAVGAGRGANQLETRLRAIRKAIAEKGAQWEVGETSLSRLSDEDLKRMLGAKPVLPEEAEEEEAKKAQDGQPTQIDWRNKDGKDWTTPIRDQGPCGSCVAFGTLGAFESLLDIWQGNPNYNWNGSEAHLFWCGGGTCEEGWTTPEAVGYLMTNGVPDEACWPYPSTSYDWRCGTTCPDWRERAKSISDWSAVWGGSSMKTHLLDGPIVAAFDVYEDFRDYTGGIYEHVWGDLLGGHAVAIVGYNDAENYWIVKNSWGTGWGETGWFKIRYGQCNIDSYMSYAMTVCPATATLEGESKESDLDLLRGFRDEVLSTSPMGRKYARLYYKYAPELTWLLLSDVELRARSREMLERLMPGFREILHGGVRQEMVLTEEMVEEIEALLSDFAVKASPGLQAVVKEMEGHLVDFEGKTLEDIRLLTSTEAERWPRPGWRSER